MCLWACIIVYVYALKHIHPYYISCTLILLAGNFKQNSLQTALRLHYNNGKNRLITILAENLCFTKNNYYHCMVFQFVPFNISK